jgi:hypothetical protein
VIYVDATGEQVNVDLTAASDHTPPTTTSDAQDTYRGDAKITLTPTDDESVGSTSYRIDGGDWQQGTNVDVPAPAEGLPSVAHTLEFYSTDGAGNTEDAQTVSFTVAAVDTLKPTTTSNAQPAYVGSASIALTASDGVNGSGVAHTYYVLDGAARQEGATVSTSTPGAHTLEFWSVDEVGNVEAAHVFADFVVTAAGGHYQSLIYTGADQTFTIPADVTTLTIDAFGAEGGNALYDQQVRQGTLGGLVRAVVPVTPSAKLTVRVGGRGSDYVIGAQRIPGWPNGGRAYFTPAGWGSGGGDGGGSSSVLHGSDILLEAGGGGGGTSLWKNALGRPGGTQGTLPGGNKSGGTADQFLGAGGGGWNGGAGANWNTPTSGDGGTSYIAAGTGTLSPGVRTHNGWVVISW